MRLENIGDIFDSNGQIETRTVNLREYVSQLYRTVNGDCLFANEIEELSLTGNQPYSLMEKNKIRWRTVDDYEKEISQLNETFENIELSQ